MLEAMMVANNVATRDTSHSAKRQPRRNQEQGTPLVEEVSDDLRSKKGRHNDFNTPQPKFNLPRMDFPSFNGEHPIEWIKNCESYFEVFQVPEMHKSRLATMHLADFSNNKFY
jgi:hypothetical protein